MYQFSRAIYRELAPEIIEAPPPGAPRTQQPRAPSCARARRSSSASPPTATTSPIPRARCSATSARTSRCPPRSTCYQVVSRYMRLRRSGSSPSTRTRATRPSAATPPQCRATTRKGAACQRMPLPHNGYCPSHQHLADTEDRELELAAA